MSINLFQHPRVIHLTQIDNGIRNNNLSFTDQDFKVYKGADFSIDFVVRNNDRKPINLVGKDLTITILDHVAGTTMMQKSITILDEHAGKARLSLTPADVQDWDIGYYDYSILIENEDGTKNLLFTDQDQNARGWFELRQGVLPGFVPSVVVTEDEFAPFHHGEMPGGVTRYASPNFPGDAQLGFADGLHTVAIYLTSFTGTLWVQGSLEDQAPDSDADWFEINITPNQFNVAYADETGIDVFNFIANVTWVRFVYEPDVLNSGTVDQIYLKA